MPAGRFPDTGQAVGVLTPEQLYALARKAGFTQDRAVTAGAIALAESGGDPSITSPNPDGGTNVGLWQLDTPGGVGAGHSVAELKDPMTNAQVAFHGSKSGTDWGPWATFGSGAYLAHTTAVTKGKTAENSGVSVDSLLGNIASHIPVIGGIVSGISGIEEVGAVLKAFVTTISDVSFWRSLGWIGLGFIIMGLAVIWFFRKQIEEGVGTVAGAAAKAV